LEAHITGLLLVGLAISPTLAQKADEQTPKQPTGKNPDCVRNFCTGYAHRKPGEALLPVVCPQED
jgi:hypothetical protein